ncbi:MAG: SDR family oxidoreductase [Planctomycetes bacterium]|nr:SDR family oxidoreductase [Planctomycetota bacterium]
MNPQRHAGKRALITGGGSGFGRATALRFAREGARTIVLVDHFQDRLDKVAGEVRALGAEPVPSWAELSRVEDCQRVIATATEHGRLDVVISNAAAWTEEPFLQMKLESWHKVIAVNLTASFVIGQAAARAMAQAGGGVILFTASVVSLGGAPHFAHYNATKAAVANLVQTMALELAPYRIRVNCVSPGPADTQQSVDIVGEELMKKFRESFPVVPLGRLAAPEDIAAAFSYLASDEAAYVTGHNLVVDGGLTAHAYTVPKE